MLSEKVGSIILFSPFDLLITGHEEELQLVYSGLPQHQYLEKHLSFKSHSVQEMIKNVPFQGFLIAVPPRRHWGKIQEKPDHMTTSRGHSY